MYTDRGANCCHFKYARRRETYFINVYIKIKQGLHLRKAIWSDEQLFWKLRLKAKLDILYLEERGASLSTHAPSASIEYSMWRKRLSSRVACLIISSCQHVERPFSEEQNSTNSHKKGRYAAVNRRIENCRRIRPISQVLLALFPRARILNFRLALFPKDKLRFLVTLGKAKSCCLNN